MKQQKSLKSSFWIHILTHTHAHITNRWTMSAGTVAPVSALRRQQPPPSFHYIVGVSVQFRGSAGQVCASCHLCQIGRDQWWLFWFPVFNHPFSAGIWETLPPAGQMGSSCCTQTSACSPPSDSQSLCFSAIHLKLLQVLQTLWAVNNLLKSTSDSISFRPNLWMFASCSVFFIG